MDNWSYAFLVTSLILVTYTVVKMIKRERIFPRFALWRRLRRRHHDSMLKRALQSALRRHQRSALNDWYNER